MHRKTKIDRCLLNKSNFCPVLSRKTDATKLQNSIEIVQMIRFEKPGNNEEFKCFNGRLKSWWVVAFGGYAW